jgi:hypothetical protein
MGIAEKFSELCNNLTIQNRSVIGSRYASITRRLNLDFWGWESDTLHSMYSGSYGRNTAIRDMSDLDMIFWLPQSLFAQ